MANLYQTSKHNKDCTDAWVLKPVSSILYTVPLLQRSNHTESLNVTVINLS